MPDSVLGIGRSISCSLHDECPAAAAAIWQRLAIVPSSRFRDLWASPTTVHLDSSIWPEILLPILWKIWEARNAAAFRNENHSPRVTITSYRDFDLRTLLFLEYMHHKHQIQTTIRR